MEAAGIEPASAAFRATGDVAGICEVVTWAGHFTRHKRTAVRATVISLVRVFDKSTPGIAHWPDLRLATGADAGRGYSSDRGFPELPLLCPAGPRHVLELELLETQLEPRQRGLVFGNPASLDRPQTSCRPGELGGDGLMGHTRGRVRGRCHQSSFVSLGRECDAGAAAERHEVRARADLHARARWNDDAEHVPPFHRHFHATAAVERRHEKTPRAGNRQRPRVPFRCGGGLPLPLGRGCGEVFR